MIVRSWFHRTFASVTIAVFTVTLAPVAVYAGTTGAISGTVTDQSGAPVAAAKVTALSASETVSVSTDASGHYAFVSLQPDEYTVSSEKNGYDPVSIAGVAVFADQTQIISVHMRKTLKTIARVTSQTSGALVRAGTTSDVYSINAAQQDRASVMGGGGNLNSAYSAISTVPGAYVPTNQAGYNQAVHVRGGDSSEVGYEFDGIPVNRGFDNYPSGSASSLGQTELQVYTGATPANAEAQGLAGFINQVIKTGTYPGYGLLDGTIGSPTFYHSLNVEAGGSTPDRRFSYYVGIGGFNQDHRYIDQWNGSSYSDTFGNVVDQCPFADAPGYIAPSSCFTNGVRNTSGGGCFDANAAAGAGATVTCPGYILGPMPWANLAAGVQDRTSVLNFHLRIPHGSQGISDDVQLLYDNDSIQTPLYISPLDEGLQNFMGQTYPPGTLPYYIDSFTYAGAPGTVFNDANVSRILPYYFPSSPTSRPFNGLTPQAFIPLTARDVQYNDQAIVKLQYQRNFSSDTFLRVYGYTYYSDYVGTGAVSSWQPYSGFDSNDYEVGSHTRGASLNFTHQFSGGHLVQLEGSYVTSTSLRMNNTTMYGGADGFAVLVNPNDLTSGTCYAIPSAPGAATPAPCRATSSPITAATYPTFASLAASFAAGAPTDGTNDLSATGLSSYTCGTGPCVLYTVENGFNGKYNNVKPNFTGAALTDEWRPTDRWLINLGARWDEYQYVGDNTTATPARAFWFNAFNQDTCYDTATLTLVDKSTLESGPFNAGTPCTTLGPTLTAANLQNVPSQVFTYDIWQPRVGATYTFNPDTVVRASYGKYIEQPSAAYEQYDSLNQNLPDQLVPFYSLGFTTPGHEVRPAVSYNADFSYERHFKGTDMSIKVTPFLRKTHDQIENFYLSIKQGFISGLNAGNQTSEGFEFAFTKGDFDRDGFAAQLGFAYTYAYLKFSPLTNGTTVLSPINADIQTYNGFTSFCASHTSDARCGVNSTNAAPCYAAGAPDLTCAAAGTIANPYWNAPPQALLDPNGKYLPYSTIPGGIGTGVNAYTYPYVATLLLQWKHKKLAISPSFQYVAGNRYGAPETTPGVDPTTCAVAAGSPTGDPRYPYGAAGGAGYDATQCTGQIVIPDPYTGQFDNLGAFREPAQLLGHLRISYDFTPRINATVTFANLLSTCFGGQQTAFTYYWKNNVCSYGPVFGGLVSPAGNVYNPGDNIQTALRYPYEPSFGTYNDLTSSIINPFSVYFELKLRV